ncbi:hypothetical protein D3C72_1995410 [compost metagenome]
MDLVALANQHQQEVVREIVPRAVLAGGAGQVSDVEGGFLANEADLALGLLEAERLLVGLQHPAIKRLAVGLALR